MLRRGQRMAATDKRRHPVTKEMEKFQQTEMIKKKKDLSAQFGY